MEYTIYLDALGAILGFLIIVHALILWSVGQILHLPLSRSRVFVASLIGTLTDTSILFFDLSMGGGAWPRAGEGALTLVALALAIKIAYRGISRRQTMRAIGYVYLFTIVSAGSSMAAYYMTGENAWVSRIVAVASLLILIEVGWGLIQERLAPASLGLILTISVDGLEAEVKALVDTGNSLTDPFSKSPVSVVRYGAIQSIMPPDIREIFRLSEADALRAMSLINPNSTWTSRMRVIPYMSLGRDDGLLVGFRPDWVRVKQGTKAKVMTDVIIGVHPGQLGLRGQFEALVPPELAPSLEVDGKDGALVAGKT